MDWLFSVTNGNKTLNNACVYVPVKLVLVFNCLFDNIIEWVLISVFDGWLYHGSLYFVRPPLIIVPYKHLPCLVKVTTFWIQWNQEWVYAFAYVATWGCECFVVLKCTLVVLQLHTPLHDDVEQTVVIHQYVALLWILYFVKQHFAPFQVVKFDLCNLLFQPPNHLSLCLLIPCNFSINHLTPETPKGVNSLLFGIHIYQLILRLC